MCYECHQNPCHPRCPNADVKIIAECAHCHNEIYEKQEGCYKQDDEIFCSLDCVLEFNNVSELDMADEDDWHYDDDDRYDDE